MTLDGFSLLFLTVAVEVEVVALFGQWITQWVFAGASSNSPQL